MQKQQCKQRHVDIELFAGKLLNFYLHFRLHISEAQSRLKLTLPIKL